MKSHGYGITDTWLKFVKINTLMQFLGDIIILYK